MNCILQTVRQRIHFYDGWRGDEKRFTCLWSVGGPSTWKAMKGNDSKAM